MQRNRSRRTLTAAARLAAVLSVALFAGCSGCFGDKTPAPTRPKRIVDLSPPLSEDSLRKQYGQKALDFFGLKSQTEFERVRPDSSWRTFGFTYYELLSHGGAHLDASARLLRDGQRPGDIPLDRLFGWARIVDMRWHDRTSPITVTDLETYKIKTNEIVILIVGYEGSDNDDWPQYAHMSEQAANWLAATGIRLIATDMPSLGSLRAAAELMEKARPPSEIWAAHVPFFQRDIPVVEGLAHLDQLIGEPRTYFAGFPLPLVDRSGAPMRAVAFVYE